MSNTDTETCFRCGTVYDPSYVERGSGNPCPTCDLEWRLKNVERTSESVATVDE